MDNVYLIEINKNSNGYLIVLWYSDEDGTTNCISNVVDSVNIEELRKEFPEAEIEVY